MKINKLFLGDALKELSKKKNHNKQLEERRRSEVLGKIPEYEQLESSLAATVTDTISSLLDKSGVLDIGAAFEKNHAIQQQMRELLEKNGFPADYLNPIYTCSKCKDTGNTGYEWCECLCRITNEMASAELNENAPLKRSTFEKFSLDRYSDIADEKDTSPKRIMERNLEYCKKFAEDFNGKGNGVFMMGGTGLGKTHLSLGIANKVIEKGFCVVYGSVPELIRKIQNEQFNGADGDTLSLAVSSDLLILDDLGAENSTDWCVSMLYEIINTRQNHNLPTIINTNLTLYELKGKYQDRLSSRMMSMKTLCFIGNDNRVALSENYGGA